MFFLFIKIRNSDQRDLLAAISANDRTGAIVGIYRQYVIAVFTTMTAIGGAEFIANYFDAYVEVAKLFTNITIVILAIQ